MATAANRLVAATVALIEGTYATAVAAAGLEAVSSVLSHAPAELDFNQAPQIWVDCGRIQKGGDAGYGDINATRTRLYHILAGVTYKGSDGETVAANLRAYVDLLIAQIEGARYIGDSTIKAFKIVMNDSYLGRAETIEEETAREAVVEFLYTCWVKIGVD